MPNGWAESAGGFPAMTGNVPFLMKDVVLLAASLYLLKQDLMRASRLYSKPELEIAFVRGWRVSTRRPAMPAPRLLAVAARYNLRPDRFDGHNIKMFPDYA